MPKAYAFSLKPKFRIIYRNFSHNSDQFDFYFNDDAFIGDGIFKGDKRKFNIGFRFIGDNRIYLVYVVSHKQYYPAHVHFDGNDVVLSCSNDKFKHITVPTKYVQIRGVIE